MWIQSCEPAAICSSVAFRKFFGRSRQIMRLHCDILPLMSTLIYNNPNIGVVPSINLVLPSTKRTVDNKEENPCMQWPPTALAALH
mmetsp:Transcript_114284/g.210043  ORF Transcript_114284/g.210043 Transcript_114284/m.210043 type:complete len:86 (-) Transcript_114284:75-332(-)